MSSFFQLNQDVARHEAQFPVRITQDLWMRVYRLKYRHNKEVAEMTFRRVLENSAATPPSALKINERWLPRETLMKYRMHKNENRLGELQW